MNTTFSVITLSGMYCWSRNGGLPFQRKCEIDMCTQAVQRLKIFIPPQTLFVGGILFSRCPSVRPSFRPSVRNALFP